MQIAKIMVVVIVLGVVLYLIYTKMIKPKSVDGGGAILPVSTTGQRRVIDANLCSWLNGTYPKLKTKEFSDIDGGANNPQARIQWEGNNCDLMF